MADVEPKVEDHVMAASEDDKEEVREQPRMCESGD